VSTGKVKLTVSVACFNDLRKMDTHRMIVAKIEMFFP
jgi:hypothetical protein